MKKVVVLHRKSVKGIVAYIECEVESAESEGQLGEFVV